ncbi:MAG: hypothetical protein ABH871_09175 [Pseudomonadota bacterium]
MADNEMAVKASVIPVAYLVSHQFENFSEPACYDMELAGPGLSVGAESLFLPILGSVVGVDVQTSMFPITTKYGARTMGLEEMNGLVWNFSAGMRFNRLLVEFDGGSILGFSGALGLGGSSLMLDGESNSLNEMGMSVFGNNRVSYGVDWIEGFVGANALWTFAGDDNFGGTIYPDVGVRFSF